MARFAPTPACACVRACLRHAALGAALLLLAGCASMQEWVHNGFKVGPNFQEPPATVAASWIDDTDAQIAQAPADCGAWWKVFRDPVLDSLIATAHQQNLDLKSAATRVLQAQAQ